MPISCLKNVSIKKKKGMDKREMEEKVLPFCLIKASAGRKVQPKHFHTLTNTYFQLVDRISSQTEASLS